MTTTHIYPAKFDRKKADANSLTVPAVLSTETPVKRGQYFEILRHTQAGVDLSRFPLPLIESHDGNQLNIGIVENPTITGGKLRANVRFGTTARAAEVFGDVQNGIIRSLSIGYEWLDYTEEADKTIVTRWKPFEVSIVSIPADQNAGFFRGKPMDTNQDDLMTIGGDELTDLPAEMTREEKRAMKVDQARVARIREIATRFDLTREAEDYVHSGATVQEFQGYVRGVQAARLKPVPSATRVTVEEEFGGYGRDNIRAAIVDGLLMRNHIAIKNPHPAARDFAAMSIHEVARILLRQKGDHSPITSAAGLIQRALATTDLTVLLADVGGKALMNGFEEMEQTHDKWVSFTEVKDFKPQKRIALSALETLSAVPELDPVSYSNLTDAQEQYTIASYQKAIGYSRQALVNDDLGGLTNLPYKLGQAARRTECDLVYSVLSTNAAMADTVALFHATHGNLLTGTNSALSATSLASAVSALRKQKDIGDNGYLGIKPRWLIVPPELEITALQLLATLVNAQSSSTAIPNSDFARIEVIVEPRIAVATNWYLIGTGVETIEVGRLQWGGGSDWSGTAAGVSFEAEKDFSTDAYNLKVRLDAGAKALSPLGMVKATGTA